MKPVVKLSETHRIKKLLRGLELNTVCEESRCPNISECFSCGTATFMVLGNVCTRGCAFCNVKRGRTRQPDKAEPYRLLDAIKRMKLRYVVITSVTRDDLPDGGASHIAQCIELIKNSDKHIRVEVLIPDFKGSFKALKTIVDASPDVLNHNVETVPRLYPKVRKGANYGRSLEILKRSKEMSPHILTKSALILGFGERWEEVEEVLADLLSVGCDILTIGQYYQPSTRHHRVEKFYTSEEFEKLKNIASSMGFRYIVSGPNVRSSYKAFEIFS
ncbi:MAG: lipoyl synthase [Aquificaceae bacterium]